MKNSKTKALSGIAIAALLAAFGWTNGATAGPREGRMNRREIHQNARIQQGVQSGEVTKREAHRLQRGQDRIERTEERAKSDGVVTNREKAHLEKMQDRQSKHIYRAKHNDKRPGDAAASGAEAAAE